nr:E3 ubiquitin-protein ligase UPL2-like [Tanacetum cinerariifolium]
WDVRVTILAFLGSLEVFLEGSFFACHVHEDCISFRHQEFFDKCHENEDVHVFLLQGGKAWFYKGFDQLVIGLAWTLSRSAISSWFVVPCTALVLLLEPFLDMGWLMDSYLIEGVAALFHHPLLMEPSSSRVISTRKTDNASDGHLERNLESSSSRLDSIFHTFRNGRQGQHGHRLRSNASSIPLGNTPTIDESQGGRVGMPRCVDMHFEQNDGVVCDVEAVSQESRGSGATLGESLRSLDVEIGSADGQDDGGERQGPRRINALLGYTSDEPRDGVAGFAPIDTAFLDALPEKLLAEVLSGRQCQLAQPPNIEPQNDSDIDPEFFAALPPTIRADVLAQQQAQGVNQAWTGLPHGVKFDPLDHKIIWHLLTKSGASGFQPHPFIDEFILTVEKDDGISYTHPHKLPVGHGNTFNLRQRPAVEGRRTVWLMQDIGASTTTVDRSNAKLLDVYRVTDMRSNEKLLDGAMLC